MVALPCTPSLCSDAGIGTRSADSSTFQNDALVRYAANRSRVWAPRRRVGRVSGVFGLASDTGSGAQRGRALPLLDTRTSIEVGISIWVPAAFSGEPSQAGGSTGFSDDGGRYHPMGEYHQRTSETVSAASVNFEQVMRNNVAGRSVFKIPEIDSAPLAS